MNEQKGKICFSLKTRNISMQICNNLFFGFSFALSFSRCRYCVRLSRLLSLARNTIIMHHEKQLFDTEIVDACKQYFSCSVVRSCQLNYNRK